MYPKTEIPANHQIQGSSRAVQITCGIILILILCFLIPPFLRTPLDCDPILFDLYARDIAGGSVLYRDMVENNTPVMVGIHWAVRRAFGDSSEALRAVDLAVVGLGIIGIVMWLPRNRQLLRWTTAIALSTFYLTSSEWCHVQRDVWLVSPVMAAMHLRRSRPFGGSRYRILEGIIWGLAIALKLHVLFVVAAVWITSAWRSRQCTGTRFNTIIFDGLATFIGMLSIVAAGIFAMNELGIWQPYVMHLKYWAGDYARANFYGPYGSWPFRIQFLIRFMPWTVIYLLAIPMAIFSIVKLFAGQRRCDDCLMAAAILGWSYQAFALQHVFDYPHVGPIMLATAFLARRCELAGWLQYASVAFVAAFLVQNASFLAERAVLWKQCLQRTIEPETRDRLLQIGFVSWKELTPVSQYIREEYLADGDVNIVSDSALPIWQMNHLKPPTRYYLFRNNLMAFPSKRDQILTAVTSLPHQKIVICDLNQIRWRPVASTPPHELPDDWYGKKKWADRVVFRSGRYVVLKMTADETRHWMNEVTDLER